MTLENSKTALRKKQAATRASAAKSEPNADEMLASFAEQLVESLTLEKDMIVSGYYPIRSELSPLLLMEALKTLGLKTALPATPKAGKPLIFHLWQSGDALIEGAYGTSEPTKSATEVTPDCLLVPLLAFDKAGRRLGYGGGFYDRSITEIRSTKPKTKAVGIAYSAQEVDQVPTDTHDTPLDAVLTEQGFRIF